MDSNCTRNLVVSFIIYIITLAATTIKIEHDLESAESVVSATTKKLESALRYIEGGAGASQRREIPHMGLPHKALTASPRSSANLSQPSGGRFGAIRDELFGWMN